MLVLRDLIIDRNAGESHRKEPRPPFGVPGVSQRVVPKISTRVRRRATQPRPNASPHVAALDGLRGIAIAAVVAYHAGVLPGGFLGVDLFFVLSGFLITDLLLRECESTGTIALRQFWTRRARRLVPATLVLVAFAQLWARTLATPAELPVINGQSSAAMVYASNWFNILFDVGYWSVGPRDSPLNHLWSVAIEGQFYIVFPVLMLLLVRWRASQPMIVLLLALLASASFALTPILFHSFGANRAYFGTDSRLGAILLGCVLAAILRYRQGSHTPRLSAVSTQVPSAALHPMVPLTAAALVGSLWWFATTTSGWLYRGGLLVHAVASVVLIVAALSDAGWCRRILSWHPLVWLGERSYSLYLWHWPLLVILSSAAEPLRGIPLLLLASLAIAAASIASYELVEQPIRFSTLRGARLVGAFGAPALLIVASAQLMQPQPPPQFGADELTTIGSSGTRIMIVGDSWARSLGIALAEVDSTRHFTVLNLGKGGCGIADAARERTFADGEIATPADCLLWPQSWRTTVERVQPEIAILSAGTWDLAPQDFDGTGNFVDACHPQFQTRYAQQLDSAVTLLGSRGARVYVMTIRDNDARPNSAPDCMNALLRAVVQRFSLRGVALLDQYAQLCAAHRCPDIVNGNRVYDATGHLAPKSQRRIAVWVLNRISGN